MLVLCGVYSVLVHVFQVPILSVCPQLQNFVTCSLYKAFDVIVGCGQSVLYLLVSDCCYRDSYTVRSYHCGLYMSIPAVYTCIYVCVCVCVCVCVRERGRERECVCVCVCVTDIRNVHELTRRDGARIYI